MKELLINKIKKIDYFYNHKILNENSDAYLIFYNSFAKNKKNSDDSLDKTFHNYERYGNFSICFKNGDAIYVHVSFIEELKQMRVMFHCDEKKLKNPFVEKIKVLK